MNNRSNGTSTVSCQMHRRSRSRQAEIQSFRRELARLDHLQDHVLDVVAERLLDVIGLQEEPTGQVEAAVEQPAVLVRINHDCVQDTMGGRGIATTTV